MSSTRRSRWGRPPLAIVVVLAVSLLLNATASWWGITAGSTGDWAPDTINPGDVFDAAAQLFANGWHQIPTVAVSNYSPCCIHRFWSFMQLTWWMLDRRSCMRHSFISAER